MELGVVREVEIRDELQRAYLDYAMSVIVARALPDVRDGLKPVQRRILYAMHELGLGPGAPYKKSARIVGEVLGKYHPHGDAAVYEAMARMAQDFSLRYPLVDGQGNFGSVDGDSPAAMRYTEARLAPIAAEMLADIGKDTVDFVPNFDATLQEPAILPAAIPNLLVNGSSGIAVGMATSIPPHNLAEVCDALIYLLDHWKRLDDIGVEELLRFIQGPDFPTGGIVYRETPEGEDALAAAYGTGRGRITVRARVQLESVIASEARQTDRARQRLVVTEIPYQVNKSSLVERIAELAREGRLEGVTDLRDESDRHGIRVVIELARTAEPEAVLTELFRHTPLESTFSIILLALVDGEPRLLTLKRALLLYLEHRQEIVTRRSRYDLERAKERAHILEGLLVALDNLDEVIDLIRRSRTAETARTNLMRRFKLTEVQAQAILDMPLKRLAALERHKLQEEYKEKQQQIRYLTALLKSPAKIREVIKEELVALKEKYADPRRTEIAGARAAVSAEELVPDVPVWVGVTETGRVARVADEGGPPALPDKLEKSDLPVALRRASTRDILYVFSADGRLAAYPVHQLPEGLVWEGKGRAIGDLVSLSGPFPAVAALVRSEARGEAEGRYEYLFLATRRGMVKRVAVADLPPVGSGTVIGVAEGDAVVGAAWTTGRDEVVLVTRAGQAIRFREEEVRPMGLPAGGVAGVKLEEAGRTSQVAGSKKKGEEDRVVALVVVHPKEDLAVVAEDGRGKRTPLTEYPTQGRYGKGVITARFAAAGVGLAGAAIIQSAARSGAEGRLVLLTEAGAARVVGARSIPQQERPAQGRSLLTLRKGDRVKRVLALG
ncbi:MAG: DNA gyrase subunit A [Thermoflexales bacterium]|nr:DNA gyrase subunit A [Thermoflexales bacterium]